MFPCVHNSHSMFSIGPCESCKRQRLRSDVKSRSAEITSRSAVQQFSGRSERSLPPERRSDFSIWNTSQDQRKRLDRRYQELLDNQNIHKTSTFGRSHELINKEIHHFHGGSFQIDRRTEQRATLGSRSGKRQFPNDKNIEHELKQSLEHNGLNNTERQYKFDWDKRDNYRLGSIEFNGNVDNTYEQRLDSRSGPRLDSRSGPRLNSRSGPRLDSTSGPRLDSRSGPNMDSWSIPRLDSRSGPRIDNWSMPRLDSRRGPRQGLDSRSGNSLWLDNASDRLSKSRESDRRYNMWSRPETRERLSTPSEKSIKVSRRRVQLRETPQYMNETEKMRTILPMIPNDKIKPILKRGKAKCVIVVHGKG